MPKPEEPGDEASVFSTGLCEAGLYLTSYSDRTGKPRRPGHRLSRCPHKALPGGAVGVRHPNPAADRDREEKGRIWRVCARAHSGAREGRNQSSALTSQPGDRSTARRKHAAPKKNRGSHGGCTHLGPKKGAN